MNDLQKYIEKDKVGCRYLVGWECACKQCFCVMNEVNYLRDPQKYGLVSNLPDGHACKCPDEDHVYVGRIRR